MMSHSERLPECEQFQCDLKTKVDKHLDESVPIRDAVKQSRLEIDMLKEQISLIKPKVDGMMFELLKAGFIGGLVGNLTGDGIKTGLIEIVKIIIK